MHRVYFTASDPQYYYVEYYYDSATSKFDLTFNLDGYDASWITTTDGSEGVYLTMAYDITKDFSIYPSSMIVCQLAYYGEVTDSWSCSVVT